MRIRTATLSREIREPSTDIKEIHGLWGRLAAIRRSLAKMFAYDRLVTATIDVFYLVPAKPPRTRIRKFLEKLRNLLFLDGQEDGNKWNRAGRFERDLLLTNGRRFFASLVEREVFLFSCSFPFFFKYI